MARRERDGAGPHVLVAAGTAAFARLQAEAPDLGLGRVPPEEAMQRALASRPRAFAWLSADAVAGLEAMLALRRARSDTQLLFVTPKSAEAERLTALEAGVDEVLSEPVSRPELAARLRLLLRRARQVRRTRLPIGDRLELDLERRELLRDGAWVHLRPREARLLELFAREPGRAHTRSYILERVWGPDHEGDPRTVDVHVRWLRSKIEPDPHAPVWLVTVRGIGYRLEQGVQGDRR